ncbi:MAG: rod shape-determining protein MreC [Rhodospirillales bacterium]|nr:rod shape-determining protein MreC [Rhodospirillales bacterium]
MQRPLSVARLATPMRAWAGRLVFGLLIATALTLMLLAKADVAVIERARSEIDDAIAPLLEALSQPVATVNGIIDYAEEMAALRARNAALKTENERLRNWQARAMELQAENSRLGALLNFVPDPDARSVTARIVGDQGGAFARSLLTNAGSVQGVGRGQAAMTGQGLAGRVVGTGERSARVLLLTDINSRIPVLVGDRRHRAVLAGDNSPNPHLLYLDPHVAIAVGDYVVTSGVGGVFPSGLPIGRVTGVKRSHPTVRPFVDWDRLEILRLIDYGRVRDSDPAPQ